MAKSPDTLEEIDKILGAIIDEWYERVAGYYVTAESVQENAPSDQEEQLKRFHDDKGHRIKFSKDELDFTYGLRSFEGNGDLTIEVSVNNKVENFDLDEFRTRLRACYAKIGLEAVPTPMSLTKCSFAEIFSLDSDFSEALKLEQREGKADIMRLSFHLSPSHLDSLTKDPRSAKQLVEKYCVTPFRSTYATVYRRGG